MKRENRLMERGDEEEDEKKGKDGRKGVGWGERVWLKQWLAIECW